VPARSARASLSSRGGTNLSKGRSSRVIGQKEKRTKREEVRLTHIKKRKGKKEKGKTGERAAEV